MINFRIGLDIGISSVGWAVLKNNEFGEPCKIINEGVRIFDAAEQPKTGASLAAPRREARSARRRLRRHRHRIDRIKNLFEVSNIITKEEIEQMYTSDKTDVHQLRCEALDRLLTKEEWARVLIHIAQRRGFKSNRKSETANAKSDSGKLLTATSENKQLFEQKGYRTVGEMLYKDNKFRMQMPDGQAILQTRNKSESYAHTILREMLIDEINILFNIQSSLGNPNASEQVKDKYIEIFSSQRSFDEGPGEPSIYGGDLIEKMLGNCTFEPEEKRCTKASYSFEYFVLLQDVNKMKIANGKGAIRFLTKEERHKIIDLAHSKDDIKYSAIRKLLNLNEDEYFKHISYGRKEIAEVEEKTKFLQMSAYHKIRKTLDKLSKNLIQTIAKEQLNEIGKILTLYKNDDIIKLKLIEAGVNSSCVEVLLELSFSKVGHLSLKSINKIIPYLEQGLQYNEACEMAGYSFKGHSDIGKSLYLNTEYIRDTVENIANPVVQRSVSQTIKVINAIIRQYGSPQVVCIELAREMSKDFTERKAIEKSYKENMEYNDKLRKQIIDLGKRNPTGQDIVKLKLWKEQNEFCAYSQEKLDIQKLFEPGYVDIDHIIPYSICFDDSYRNKVLVKSEHNRQKGNRLPFEYIGKDEKNWNEFTVFVNQTIKDYRKRERLLKNSITPEEENEFKERNLNDTKYITRVMYNLINDCLIFAPSDKYSKKRVIAVNGSITSYLRKRWGIDKNREENDLHHAQDAIVVACVSDGMIQKISKYSKGKERTFNNSRKYVDFETGEILSSNEYDEKYGIKFPEPWIGFSLEREIRKSNIPGNYMSELAKLGYDIHEEVKPIFVSRMPKRKCGGAGHLETIRSGKHLDENIVVTKTDIKKLKLDKDNEIVGYHNPQDDTLLYNALKNRLIAFNGNGEKAFAETFYKPKSDGSLGNPVKKVKVFEKITLGLKLSNKGYASNGDMVRIDIFTKDNKYYFVPIYTADTLKSELPKRAVVAAKPYDEWKIMDEHYEFIFSLYPNDLVKIVHKKGINAKKNNGEKIITNDIFLYFRGADISTGGLDLINSDNSFSIHGLGITTLQSIEKYQVDVLGNITKVGKETRQTFNKKTDKNEKYNKKEE